ncbi:MAG: hypothetical protein ACOCRX_04320 [Candidatus Woesearchaeota archaeon]
MKKEKVFRIPNTDSIIIINIELREDGKNYISVTGDIITPITIEQAEEITRRMLEDGELYREEVYNNGLEKSKEEWIEEVLKIDGKTCMTDTSLYSEQVSITYKDLDKFDNLSKTEKDEVVGDYLYKSVSCGCQHKKIRKVIKGTENEEEINKLINLHLNDDSESIKKGKELLSKINEDNVDKKVREITLKILTTK